MFNHNTDKNENLNALGCIEAIQERMKQLDAILYSLGASAEKIDHNIVQAVMAAACSMVKETDYLAIKLYEQLPRKED